MSFAKANSLKSLLSPQQKKIQTSNKQLAHTQKEIVNKELLMKLINKYNHNQKITPRSQRNDLTPTKMFTQRNSKHPESQNNSLNSSRNHSNRQINNQTPKKQITEDLINFRDSIQDPYNLKRFVHQQSNIGLDCSNSSIKNSDQKQNSLKKDNDNAGSQTPREMYSKILQQGSTFNEKFKQYVSQHKAQVQQKQDPSASNLFSSLSTNSQQSIDQNLILCPEDIFILIQKEQIFFLLKDQKQSIQLIQSFLNNQFKSKQNGIVTKQSQLENSIMLLVAKQLVDKKFLSEENQFNLNNSIGYIYRNIISIIQLIYYNTKNNHQQKSIHQELFNILQQRNCQLNKQDKLLNIIQKNFEIADSMIKLIFETENHTSLNKIKNIIKQQQQYHELVQICQNNINITQKDSYLPNGTNGYKYTLVLDLDETLVHYHEEQECFLVRPYVAEFLESMAKYYEIVVFTAATQDYADYILNLIDQKKFIKHRLYRQHTTLSNEVYVKDLGKLNRAIEKIIIVDNTSDNFKLHPQNGIYIQSWTGDEEDEALLDLENLLKQIVIKNVSDVRDALSNFREQILHNINKGMSQPHINIQL